MLNMQGYYETDFLHTQILYKILELADTPAYLFIIGHCRLVD